MQASSRLGRAGFAIGALVVVTTLASCGGSDNGNAPVATAPVAATNTPPDSASASVSGFIAFLKTLVATTSDTALPLDISTTFVAPTDDTGAFDPTI